LKFDTFISLAINKLRAYQKLNSAFDALVEHRETWNNLTHLTDF
jgi:hypothetical protein